MKNKLYILWIVLRAIPTILAVIAALFFITYWPGKHEKSFKNQQDS
jgi:hypothetical protein